MNADQYRAALIKLDMTQQSAADFLEVSLRTSQSYALGEVRIPGAVGKLLRLMIRRDIEPKEVR